MIRNLVLQLLCVLGISLIVTGYNSRLPGVGLLPGIERAPGVGRPVRNVETEKEWRQLEYGFANEQDRQQAENDGNLVPENGTPIDVQPHYLPNGTVRLFTTIPRFVTGIPYSLATVSRQQGNNGPLLQPYPSFDWHNNNGDDCDKLTSVFRVSVSESCSSPRIFQLRFSCLHRSHSAIICGSLTPVPLATPSLVRHSCCSLILPTIVYCIVSVSPMRPTYQAPPSLLFPIR